MNGTCWMIEIRTMSARFTTQLLNISIDRVSLSEATGAAMAAIDRRRAPLIFVCANPHSLVVAQRDFQFHTALNNADLVAADGVGITLLARIAGHDIGPRITGHDFFQGVMHVLQQRGGGRVLFFGSSPKVLALIAARLQKDYPAVTLCGAISPPFGAWSTEENAEMISRINAAQADVLWVGMTAPKQEMWVENNRSALNVPVIASIGAVFDFFAETHPRAPKWLCAMGCEWLYRLLREPRRMWRRNFVSTPQFVLLILWRHILGFNARQGSG